MNTEPPPIYIRLAVVQQQVPLSKSGIYQMVAAGLFLRLIVWLQGLWAGSRPRSRIGS